MSTETITWIDPDGTTTVLADLRGITGRGHPPVAFNDQVVPLQPGTMFRSVRDAARQVVIPIILQSDDLVGYRTALRELAATLHPSSTPGRLQVSTVDDQIRELNCWYIDGFGLLEEFPDYSKPSLLFRACDPYWYDADDVQMDFSTGSDLGLWFPMLFPFRIAASEVFAAATIDNDGNVDAWPVWTVTGPGDSLILRNLTTDKLLSLPVALATGDTVTIDTRPGYKTVTRTTTNDLFTSLSDDSGLWPLAKGLTSVQVELPAATSSTLVSLRFKRRWLTV